MKWKWILWLFDRSVNHQREMFIHQIKSFWNMDTRTVLGILFSLLCVKYIFFWCYGRFRFEGNNKYADKILHQPCVDDAAFSFGTWLIRSCLLCKFISLGACSFSFPSIFRRFRKENRIAELFHWSEFKDRKYLQATQKRVRTCKDYVIGREITIALKIVVNN